MIDETGTVPKSTGDFVLVFYTMNFAFNRWLPSKYRPLLVLMCLASLGSILFQCFWLYTTYINVEQRFIGIVDRVFFESIRTVHMTGAMEKGMGDRFPEKAMIDSLQARRRFSPDRGMRPPNRRPMRLNPGDRPPGPLPMWDIDYDESVLKERMYIAFAQEGLADMEMRLDTLQYKLEIGMFVPVSALGGVYEYSTNPMIIDPSEHLFVQLSFDAPFSWMFGKLVWPCCASVILMVITVGCLIYMLYTIVRQKRLSDIKDDFVNNMTHELRTPVATVMAALDTLAQPHNLNNSQKVSLYIQLGQKAAAHLNKMIDQVLEIAYWQSQGVRLHKEDVDVSLLVQDVVDEKQALLDGKAEIHIEAQGDLPLMKLDLLHVRNAIGNVLDNAVKYANEAPVISIRSVCSDGFWEIAIEDNGIGIKKQDMEFIFQPFYRVSTGNTHTVKGFGIGLHYVRQVVEGHGGSVSVVSIPGNGTIFRLRLPFEIDNKKNRKI